MSRDLPRLRQRVSPSEHCCAARSLCAHPLLSSGHVPPQLLADKNTIVNAITTSHRVRLRKIDKRESDMLCNIYRWQNSVTEKVRDPRTQGDGAQTGLAQVARAL